MNLKHKREINRPGFYKLLGIIILITQFEFTIRYSLWNRAPISKYIPAPNIGITSGMSSPLVDELWRALQWSEQPKEISEGVSHSYHRWVLIDDMVEIFNQHREEYVYVPSVYVWINLYHAGVDLGVDG